MSDLDTLEKYLKWALEKVEEMKIYDTTGTFYRYEPSRIVLNDLISYIVMAEQVLERLYNEM